MHKYCVYIFIVSLATFLAITCADPQQPDTEPFLYNTITFSEPIAFDTDCLKNLPLRTEHDRTRSGTSNAEKAYQLFQNGVPLTEEEKQQVIDGYKWMIPDDYLPLAYKIISGDLTGTNSGSLATMSWLLGVDYDLLMSIRDRPETVPHMAHVRSLLKRSETRKITSDGLALPNVDVAGFYGGGTGKAHESEGGYKASEPLGVYFRPGTAKKNYDINFNGDLNNHNGAGGIDATIYHDKAKTLKFTVHGGFEGAIGFQVGTSKDISLIVDVYSDIYCKHPIASSTFTVDSDQYSDNDGAIASINFEGVGRCVTIANAAAARITVPMDNIVFGTPYSGFINFYEAARNPKDRLTPASFIDYYGGGTKRGVFAAKPLGIQFGFDPSSSFSNFPKNHISVSHPTLYSYSARISIPRGFASFFGIFVSTETADFSPIQFNFFEGADCGSSVGSSAYFYPENAQTGVVYQASVLFESNSATCVDIIYTGQTGSAYISGLLFGDVSAPTPQGYTAEDSCADGYVQYPVCYPALTSGYSYIFNQKSVSSEQYMALSSAHKAITRLSAVTSYSSPLYSTFKFTDVGSALVTPSGQCLDVAYGKMVAGTTVQLYGCTGRYNQQWQFVPASQEGWGTIHPLTQGSNLCLGTVNDGYVSDTRVVLQACDGQQNQLWDITQNTVSPFGG